jgi:hypothetical protein
MQDVALRVVMIYGQWTFVIKGVHHNRYLSVWAMASDFVMLPRRVPSFVVTA